jgi:hypothetical protein
LNLEKCMFLVHSRVILGYVVSKEGMLLDPRILLAIVHMPTPKTTKDIQVYNGMAQYYWFSLRSLLLSWLPLPSY